MPIWTSDPEKKPESTTDPAVHQVGRILNGKKTMGNSPAPQTQETPMSTQKGKQTTVPYFIQLFVDNGVRGQQNPLAPLI